MTAFVLIGMLLSPVFPAAHSQAGEINGHLLFADGTPVAGALVSVVPVPDPGQPVATLGRRGARTDDAGAFRVRNVAPGRYYLGTGPVDSVSYYPGVATTDAASVVTIAAGSVVEDLDFALPPSVANLRVGGRVARVPSATAGEEQQSVRLSGGLRSQNQTSVIAEDGTFGFRGVRAGAYSLIVRPAPGMQPVTISVLNNVDDVVLTVPRLTLVNGTVAIEGDAIRPAFSLRIDGPFRTTANVRSDGTFTARLPDGEYRLIVNELPAGYYLQSVNSGESDLFANPLRIIGSDEPVPIAVVLANSPGVAVRGRLTVPGASTDSNLTLDRIVLTGSVVRNTVETRVNTDGSFQIANMMPGSYVARVPLTPAVSSPPITVVIPNRDVEDLEIPVPLPKEVSGSAVVAGNGPPPKFELVMIRDGEERVDRSEPPEVPSLPVASTALFEDASAGRVQVLTVDVNPLSDGTFRMSLPQGEYTVGVPPDGIPSAYLLSSLTYGQADLRTEPLVVNQAEYAELQAGFVTVIPSPWVGVSGRVVGFDPTQGPFRVALESNVTAVIETFVGPDGTFEFPRVLQDTTYTARLMPVRDAVPPTRVSVGDEDVAGVEIVVSEEFEVTGRVVVEGDGPTPGFVIELVSPRMSVSIEPRSDGSFTTMLPGDERRVRIGALPLGYEVLSLTYGEVDLLEEPLMITAGNADLKLGIVLNVDPNVRWGALEGRVTGLDPQEGAVRIELSDVIAISTFEASVGRDGSFRISKIPQGTYVAYLLGSAAHRSLTPASIPVHGGETTRAELAAGGPDSGRLRPPDRDSTGATVAEIGANGGAASSESAAVRGLRTVNTAQVTYMSARDGRYGNLSELIAAGLVDSRFNETTDGFDFSVISIGGWYAVAAIPASSGNGRFAFYSTPDGVIRYSRIERLIPVGQGGNPVQ